MAIIEPVRELRVALLTRPIGLKATRDNRACLVALNEGSIMRSAKDSLTRLRRRLTGRKQDLKAYKPETIALLRNTRVISKIMSVVVAITVLSAACAVYLVITLQEADSKYRNFISTDEAAAVLVAKASQRTAALGYTAYQVIAHPNDANASSYVSSYLDDMKNLTAHLKQAKALLPASQFLIDEFIGKANKASDLVFSAIQSAQINDLAAAKVTMQQADALILEVLNQQRKFINTQTAGIAEKSSFLAHGVQSDINIAMVSLFVSLCAALAFALVVSVRGIARPIESLRLRMEALAKGDTSSPIVGVERRDEVGRMATAVSIFRENAIERLRLENETENQREVLERDRTIRERKTTDDATNLRFAVNSLAEGLRQLANGNVGYQIENALVSDLDALRIDFNTALSKLRAALAIVDDNAKGIDATAIDMKSSAASLAKRTEQQAASVEETAAAVEELTTTLTDSARRAQEVSQLVARTRGAVDTSELAMSEVVTAIEKIEKSSQQISEILGMIDDIALQTNLLALNAGIEAARAGDVGRGFAVVAQEVRELAQRSAQAADEIKKLISISTNEVCHGVALIGRTHRSFGQIVVEIQQVDRHVSAIVKTAGEQAATLQSINDAINEIDQKTQQNAAIVEQSTSSSNDLAFKAGALTALLGQFNVTFDAVNAGSDFLRPVEREINTARTGTRFRQG